MRARSALRYALALGVLPLPACGQAADADRAASATPAPTAPARPAAAPDTSFDARGWLRDAAAVWDSTTWAGDEEAALALSRRHADALDRAVGWKAACAEPFDGVFEDGLQTGLMVLHPLGGDEFVVELTCQFFAYQGAYVLIHLEGPAATLVRAPTYDYTGARIEEADAVFSTPEFWPDAPPRTFATFARGRGFADCGVFTRYRLGRGAEATVVEVRARECTDEPLDDIDPGTWPVVYPR